MDGWMDGWMDKCLMFLVQLRICSPKPQNP